ncbi:MAG: hypothetical protein SFV81_20345 [Pirellulaceae bacterium]|nr:hypothetical protein [Pirellulaceae bacterium]
MSRDLLIDISRALEEKSYREKDAAILEYLRALGDEDALRAQLSEVSHVHDAAVLDDLIRVGVNAESFTAFSLLPLLRVAWSDGEVADSERTAILKAAEAIGIKPESASYKLLEGWLETELDQGLLDAWHNYARGLARELDENSLAAVRHATIDRARRVAQAAGGILGIGNRISKNEELSLLGLAHAFDKSKLL